MTARPQAPSADDWIGERAIDLLDGRRILVRALPRTGKSWFAERIAQGLGETATLVRGREFTEKNQAGLRGDIVQELKDHVARFGCAQLIFDDYHRALARSQGGRLQAQLYSALVDSPEARDIGSIFFARQMTPVHLSVRGSPLASRLDPATLPEWDQRDLQHYGVDEPADRLACTIGRSLSDLHRYSTSGYAGVVDRLRVDGESIVRDLPSDATEALVGLRAPTSLSPDVRLQMAGLICAVTEGVRLSTAVVDADLRSCVHQTTAWPSDFQGSAKAFAGLLDGCETALWSDRYLSTDPKGLLDFLLAVRKVTDCQLRLLMGERVNGALVDMAGLKQIEEDCTGVSIRLMTSSDFVDLHDRHLVRLGESGGWAIPMFAALCGRQPVGSAVATRAAGFGVDYGAVWTRSIRPADRLRLLGNGTRH